MLAQENPSVLVNTGSKQGITNPSGNAAYNASKAAVKSLMEGLSWELGQRPNGNVAAHLFIPGQSWTGIVGGAAEGAWTAEETAGYVLERVRSGDFYIVVPDNDKRHAP